MKAELVKVLYPKTPADETNGFRIIQYKALEDAPEAGITQGTVFVGKGKRLPMEALTYELEGAWGESKYGSEMSVRTVKEIPPETPKQLEAFILSMKLPGIGVKSTPKIVKYFGTDSLRVLEEEPERLVEVPDLHLAKSTPAEIREVVKEKKQSKELFDVLSSYGIKAGKVIDKIRSVFKERALEIVTEHPFRLASIHGISYATAREIAMKKGMSPLCEEGIEGAIIEALKVGTRNGDMFVYLHEMPDYVSAVIGQTVTFEQIKASLIRLAQEPRKKIVISKIPDSDKKAVYDINMYNAERSAADTVICLEKYVDYDKDLADAGVSKGIERYEKKKRITFNDEQKEAIRIAIQQPVSVITGGPGTGKTSIIDAIYYIFMSAFPDKSVLMCAPTGCAARRITESTGISAKTIHSALHIRPAEDDSEPVTADVELDTNLIIVDEMSMVDGALFSCLVSAVGHNTRLVLIGDADQLPSVGAGNVLHDLVDSGRIPTVKLTKIYRQKNGTTIAPNAKRIREGNNSLDYSDPSFQFVEVRSKEECIATTKMIYETEVKAFGLNNVAVLCPYRKKSPKAVNTEELNELFRERANPRSERKKEATINGVVYRVGDKVMQCQNTENTANGDIGYITDIDYGEGVVVINFGYAIERLKFADCTLAHAYATSVHKSQGQQYKTVIIDLMAQHYTLLYRNLLYTAVTRATQRVIIVGDRFALNKCIESTNINNRKSLLSHMIDAMYKEAFKGYLQRKAERIANSEADSNKSALC